MAYYTCGKCHFTFTRSGDVTQCPDCGHHHIREAEAEEVREYERNRVELGNNAAKSQSPAR